MKSGASRLTLLIGIASLLAVSCATKPALPPAEPDVLGPLSPAAYVYLEARDRSVRTLAVGIEAAAVGKDDGRHSIARSLAGLAERGRLFGLALIPEAPALAQGDAAGSTGAESFARSPASPRFPAFEALVAGDFDPLGLWFNFVCSPGWSDSKGQWRNSALGLSVALPKTGLLAAAAGDAAELSTRARTPTRPASPLPARYAGYVDKGIVAWLPEPLSRLAPRLGAPVAVAEMDLGLVGALVVAEPEPGRDAMPVEIRLLFADENRARLGLPASRLAWLFVSKRLPLASGSSPGFSREGDEILVSGVELSAGGLAALALGQPPAD